MNDPYGNQNCNVFYGPVKQADGSEFTVYVQHHSSTEKPLFFFDNECTSEDAYDVITSPEGKFVADGSCEPISFASGREGFVEIIWQ